MIPLLLLSGCVSNVHNGNIVERYTDVSYFFDRQDIKYYVFPEGFEKIDFKYTLNMNQVYIIRTSGDLPRNEFIVYTHTQQLLIYN